MVYFNWKRGSKLGAGSYGTVYKALTTDVNYPVIAVKSATYPEHKDLINEDYILTELLGCSHVVRNLGNEITEETEDIAFFNMFLEYASGGTLEDRIYYEDKKLEEKEVAEYTRQILQGLCYVHEKGYVHCDLKPGNILLFEGNQLKIADFGLSKKVGVQDSTTSRLFRGTPNYMSPESVDWEIHEPPLDIWSLGCTVVEMFTGKCMWSSCKNLKDIYYDIVKGDVSHELPREISVHGRDFLKKCFEYDHYWRPDAETLLKHPFVAENYGEPVMLPTRLEMQSSKIEEEVKEEADDASRLLGRDMEKRLNIN